MLKLEGERSARMADGKARIKAAMAARSLSDTSEQLRKTSETVVTTAAPPQQQAEAVAPPPQQASAAAAVLQTALDRKTSEVVGGEQAPVGRVQDFFNAAATAANASISATTVAAAAVGASPPSNATAAATAVVSADALAMPALAADTASEPVVTATKAEHKAEQEKTSEEMQAELASLDADPLMQEAEARRKEFLEARGAIALPTLENVTIPADGAAALETKPAPFDPNLASLLMSPQMSSKATNLMATETERPLPAASSIAKALRSDLAYRKEVPMKLL